MLAIHLTVTCKICSEMLLDQQSSGIVIETEKDILVHPCYHQNLFQNPNICAFLSCMAQQVNKTLKIFKF